MTKEELKSALEAAVGGTAYGDEIIKDLTDTFGTKYTPKDRLDERVGTLRGWEKKHHEAGENEKAAAEAEKIAICEKALAAIEKLA